MRGRKEEELASHLPVENGLGAAVRAWRHFHGLTVTELAVRAGFGKNGRGYISRIEHSLIRHLSEERLERIAAALQLQRTDLLLHRMPETHAEAPAYDLEEVIIGGKALLKVCEERSFDWARIHLLLAKLYRERAATAHTTMEKYIALTEAQQCIECALLVFNATTTRQSFREATLLGQEIDGILETCIIAGSLALLKRCSPKSLDWARIELQLAKFYYERAEVLQGAAARTALAEAQQCVEAAILVFTQKQAERSLKEAGQLHKEIRRTIGQLDGL